MWGFLVMETFGLFLPSMRAELSLTPVREGLLGAAPQVAILIFSIPFGLHLSRFSPKLLTLASIAGAVAVIFFQAWAPVYALFLLGRFLYGLSLTVREPAHPLLLRMWIPARQILIANASIELLWSLGSAFFIVVPLVLEALGGDWRRTMQVLGYATIGLGLLWLLVGRERPASSAEGEPDAQRPVSIRGVLRHKELWLLAMGLLGVEITFSSFETFWPAFMLDRYDVTIKTSALLWTITGLVAGPTGLAVNLVVNRLGKRRTALRIGGVYVVLTTIPLLYSGSFPVLVAISILHGMCFSFYPIVMTIPFQLKGIRAREIAVAMGFLTSALTLGGVSGPVLAGFIHEVSGDQRLALTLVGFSGLALTLGALFLSPEWDRRPDEAP